MTKYIPEQDRVSGMFPVGVNGVTSYFRVGQVFEENEGLLSALDGAGVEYTDPPYTAVTGDWTGRIKITSVSTRIHLAVNGFTISTIFGNVFFTPTDQELSVIQDSNLVWQKEYGPILSSDAGIGDQIFPTPTFADETGVIDLGGWTISNNTLTESDGDTGATFAPTKVLVEGIYYVLVTQSALDQRELYVEIGGSGNSQPITWSGLLAGGFGGDAEVVVDDITAQTIKIREAGGNPATLTGMTVSRTS